MGRRGRVAQWVGPSTLRFTVIKLSLSSAPARLKQQSSRFLVKTCPTFFEIGMERGKVKDGKGGRVVAM